MTGKPHFTGKLQYCGKNVLLPFFPLNRAFNVFGFVEFSTTYWYQLDALSAKLPRRRSIIYNLRHKQKKVVIDADSNAGLQIGHFEKNSR